MDDKRTSNAFVWDGSGEHLLIQRFKIVTDASQANDSVPEIWSYFLKSGTLTQLVTDAVEPHWLP
jgi:hypothetical protein